MTIKKTSVISGIIILLVLTSFVSAISNDLWEHVGGNDTNIIRSASDLAYAHFEYGNNISLSSDSINGISPLWSYGVRQAYFEPLVTNFGSANRYIITTDSQYINLFEVNTTENFVSSVTNYDSGFNSSIEMPFDVIDMNGDGKANEIVYIDHISTNRSSFNIIQFNSTSEQFTRLFQFNFTTLNMGSTYNQSQRSNGVRCVSGNSLATSYCNTIISEQNYTAGVFNNYYYRFYGNGSTFGSLLNVSASYNPIQPLIWKDINNDGILEYLMISPDKITIFNNNGVDLLELYPSASHNFWSGQFMKQDLSSNYAILTSQFPTGASLNSIVKVNRIDGSTVWTKGFDGSSFSNTCTFDTSPPSIFDYNVNGIDDVFLLSTCFTTLNGGSATFSILNGYNGSTIYSHDAGYGFISNAGNGFGDFGVMNTIANLEGSSSQVYPDFISNENGKFFIFSPNNNSLFYNTSKSYKYCIPANAGNLNKLDIVCLGSNVLDIYSTDNGNLNCNFDSICNGAEDVFSCPSDCGSPPTNETNETNETLIIGGENGTLAIPIQIVDVNNQQVGNEKGILPEIYYGLLGFFSNAFVPMFIIAIAIFIVLLMGIFFTIVVKLMHKIGG